MANNAKNHFKRTYGRLKTTSNNSFRVVKIAKRTVFDLNPVLMSIGFFNRHIQDVYDYIEIKVYRFASFGDAHNRIITLTLRLIHSVIYIYIGHSVY